MNASSPEPGTPDLKPAAQLALSCLDLTSLNPQDTEADIARLCERAQTPFGPVAAVCVWPHLAAFARRLVPPTIAVAAVANFPDGSADMERAVRETGTIVQSGAQEVDVVLPYKHLLAGDERAAAQLLAAVRKACPALVLKVILETGELKDARWIERACRISLDAGADFLKTSTGKTPISASIEAARTMLEAIAKDSAAANRVGFKASGGIRTVREAASYIAVCQEYLGEAALNAGRFRIGASSLLDDIQAVLADGVAPSPATGY